MVLTAVALSRWNASRAVATILNYCDKFSHSRLGFLCLGLFFLLLLLLLFLNRSMCYSHPENNTGEKRLEEGRRAPHSTQIFVSLRAGRGSSTVWDTVASHWRRRTESRREFLTEHPWTPSWASNEETAALTTPPNTSALMEMVKPHRPVQTPDTLLTPHENNIKKIKKKIIHPRLCKKHRHGICPLMWKCAKKIPGMASAWLLSDLKVPDVWCAQRNSPETGIPKSTLNTNKPPDQVAQKSISPMHGWGTFPSYLVFSVKFHRTLLGASTAAPALLFPSLQFSIARSTCGSHLQELD